MPEGQSVLDVFVWLPLAHDKNVKVQCKKIVRQDTLARWRAVDGEAGKWKWRQKARQAARMEKENADQAPYRQGEVFRRW